PPCAPRISPGARSPRQRRSHAPFPRRTQFPRRPRTRWAGRGRDPRGQRRYGRELAVLLPVGRPPQDLLPVRGAQCRSDPRSGAPGIGKSHTGHEAARRAVAHGMQVYWGRCNEEPGAPPYWPWQQVLQAWVDAQDEATLQRLLGRAADVLAGLLPELAHRLPG